MILQNALTAAHCSKTLVAASTLGNPALSQSAKLLLPGMIECVAKVCALDDSESSERAQIIGEIWKAFAAMFASTADEHSTSHPPTTIPSSY